MCGITACEELKVLLPRIIGESVPKKLQMASGSTKWLYYPPMGFLILGVLAYSFIRRLMPNATFYSSTMVAPKLLVIVLLVVSVMTGLTSHIQIADVIALPLCVILTLTVCRTYEHAGNDAPQSSPFLALLAFRGPPAF
jgi:hypothetical protein